MILIVGGAYQGKTQYGRSLGSEMQLVEGYHLQVRQQLEQGENPLQKVRELLEGISEKEKLVIISDEQGCGVVPMDPLERRYREISGRVNCYLAQEADTVIHMVCGIPHVIKGQL